MVKRLGLPAFLAVALLVLTGAGGGSYDGGTYASRGGGYLGGGASKVDTLNLLYRSATHPNIGAVAAGYIGADGAYDAIYESDDGTHLKYAYVQQSDSLNPVIGSNQWIYGKSAAEDDRNFTGSYYASMIWFSLDGLPAGSKIEDAWFYINIGSAQTPTTGYFAVRGDTVSLDYRMLSAGKPASTADNARMNVSWSYVDVGNTTRWTPDLISRRDWHDWGPRSDTVMDSIATLPQGHVLAFRVKDIIQQVVDNGESGRGIILIPYQTNLTNLFVLGAGNSSNVTNNMDGNPCLSIKATTPYRGQRPWGNGDVPLVMTWDDCTTDQVLLHNELTTNEGYDFDAMVYATACSVSAPYRAFLDLNAGSTTFNIHHHSYNHKNLGEAIAVGGWSLRNNIYRGRPGQSYYAPPFVTTEIDTLTIKHYAYPGGSDSVYTMGAFEHLLSAGYLSARAAEMGDTTTAIGQFWASWSEPFNKYAVGSVPGDVIFDINSAATEKSIKERLTDWIDAMYTDYGKSALVLYSHDAARDSVSAGRLDSLITYVEQMNNVRIMAYGDMVNLRTAGAAHPTLADITQPNGYSRAWAKTAAKYDSLATAIGDSAGIASIWYEGK